MALSSPVRAENTKPARLASRPMPGLGRKTFLVLVRFCQVSTCVLRGVEMYSSSYFLYSISSEPNWLNYRVLWQRRQVFVAENREFLLNSLYLPGFFENSCRIVSRPKNLQSVVLVLDFTQLHFWPILWPPRQPLWDSAGRF